MKKEYITPEINVSELELEPVAILPASMNVDQEQEPDEELSNNHRKTWGNLWQ